jgi:hypothetical protein
MRFSPATVIAGLALVFAMTGGAYAAKKYLITSTKQISPSVLKQLQGKSGANGANGAAGTAGAQGPQGPAGPAGSAGSAGAKGETGTAGKEGLKGVTGKEGPGGPEGSAGSPWTVGGTLPSKATETGTWSFGKLAATVEAMRLPISFPIPLAATLNAEGCEINPVPATCQVHYINVGKKEVLVGGTEVTSTACPGTTLEPKAEPGNLCIYTKSLSAGVGLLSNGGINKGGGSGGGAGALTIGAFLLITEPEEGAVGVGTWAVTAP